jgi:hypothetical protein
MPTTWPVFNPLEDLDGIEPPVSGAGVTAVPGSVVVGPVVVIPDGMVVGVNVFVVCKRAWSANILHLSFLSLPVSLSVTAIIHVSLSASLPFQDRFQPRTMIVGSDSLAMVMVIVGAASVGTMEGGIALVLVEGDVLI